MLCLDSSKIDILFVMTDIDKDILTDIRAALATIREQIDVIDKRLERMTENCSDDADTVEEESVAVLPSEDDGVAAEVAAEAFEWAVEEEVSQEAEDVEELESGEEPDTEECVDDAEETLPGERENFSVGEEISLGGDLEMAFADSDSLENADAEEVNIFEKETTDAAAEAEEFVERVVASEEFAEGVAEAEEFAERAAETEEFAPTLSGIVENDGEAEEDIADVVAEATVAADVVKEENEEDAIAEEVAVDAVMAEEVEERVESVDEKPKEPVRFAWRTDRPGSPVRNILSAISLNDRMLFIRTLFADDPALFQKTISVFNFLSSLAEAEAYIRSHFPKWDMSSDTVYRFMMAARRRFS